MEQHSDLAARDAAPNSGVQQGHSREMPEQNSFPHYLFETKPLPVDHLSGWLALLETGYEGDALADTEALYDEP